MIWPYRIIIIATIAFVIISIIIGYHEYMKLEGVLGSLKEFFDDAWDKAENFASFVKGKIELVFATASDKVKQKVSEWAKGVADNVVEGPKEAIEGLKETIKKVAEAAGKGEIVKNLNPGDKREIDARLRHGVRPHPPPCSRISCRRR
jgi:uncharacterized protein YjbJ (UPF0337 family)